MEYVFKAPIRATRNSLYTSVSLISLFFVLLPLSVVTYFKFYNTIVPNSFHKIPLQFDTTKVKNGRPISIDEKIVTPFSHSWESSIYLESQFLMNEKYKLNFHIPIQCLSSEDRVLSYTIKGRETSTHMIRADCDSTNLYLRNNWFVPYSLRLHLPSILWSVEDKSSMDFEVSPPEGLLERNHLSLTMLETSFGNVPPFYIIDDDAFVLLTFQWDGFRYYMVRYYFTFLVVGTLIFWSISSFVWICISSYIWTRLTVPQEKEKQY